MALNSLSGILYSQCVQCDNTINPSGIMASEIGVNTTAEGENSFAGGINSLASGYCSFSFGNQAQATGNYCYAIGPSAIAGNSGTFALGRFINSNAYQAFVLGNGINTLNLLTNNIPNSMMIGLNSNLPTLFVEGSLGLGRTGRIGIGNITSPQAKLHIKGDPDEITSVLIEPALSSNSAWLYLGNTSYGIKYSPTRLEFLSGDKFVFYSGNIGIGTYTPTERLEIKGNIKQQSGYRIETERILSTSAKGLQLYNSSNKGIVIDNSGNIGINTPQPTANLQVNGKILTTSLQIPDPAPDDSTKSVEGYVLRSWDAYGNVAWTPQSSLDDGDWTKSGNNIYRATGNVGIGLTNPACPFEVKKSGITSD